MLRFFGYSFLNNLLSTCHVPGTVLCAGGKGEYDRHGPGPQGAKRKGRGNKQVSK